MKGGSKLKIIGLIIFLIFYIVNLIFPSHVLANPTKEQTNTIKVAGDNHYPPFEYLADSGTFTGFNVDIMNAVSVETGKQIEFFPMPWNEAVKALREGKVDIIQGMIQSDQRDEIYDFSEDIIMISQAIFVLKENYWIHQLQDLQNAKVVVQKDDISYDVVKKYKLQQVQYVENQEEAIQLLLEHKASAFLGNRITGQYILQKLGRQENVKMVGEPINPIPYAMAVMPSNKHLLDDFNQGIKHIKQNGTYSKIEEKWFGKYILSNESKHLQQILKLLQYTTVAISLVTLLFIWWNVLLKREVRRRTSEMTRMNSLLEANVRQLKENDQFKQQLLDTAYSSFVTLDRDGCISLFNHRAKEILKWKNQIKGMEGKKSVLAEFIPTGQMEISIVEGRSFLHQETTWSKEGQVRYIRYHIVPFLSSEQQVSGIILSFQDITEQKKMWERIQREDRLRSLGQMVAVVAHEIRNPLMSILTYTKILPQKYDNPAFRDTFIQQVPIEINRLNQVVNNLIDFSKPKRAKPAHTQIEPIIQSILFLVTKSKDEKAIQMDVRVDEELIAFADPGQLMQILLNLTLNAIEASPYGKWIWIRAYQDDEWTIIEIQDQGEGILQADLDQIFDPFFTTKPDGTGLGLAICDQLVKENHGRLRVDSQIDRGTLFQLYLPTEECAG